MSYPPKVDTSHFTKAKKNERGYTLNIRLMMQEAFPDEDKRPAMYHDRRGLFFLCRTRDAGKVLEAFESQVSIEHFQTGVAICYVYNPFND